MTRLYMLLELCLVVFVIILFYKGLTQRREQKVLKAKYDINTQEDIDLLVDTWRVQLEQKKTAYGEESEKYKKLLKEKEIEIEKLNKIKITN